MDQQQVDQARVEALGPAEQIINTLTTFTDHMIHNRPGMVTQDARTNIGVRWVPVTYKDEEGTRVVYRLDKVGKRKRKTRIGTMNGSLEIKEGRRVIGEYRKPGIFPESAVYFYKQIAEVWKMDNEFAARWASWSFPREHKDLKVALAAFMLVQSRKGDAIKQGGEFLMYDEDYRNIGEAMCLIRQKGVDLSPKMLLRIGDLLRLPAVAEINRELGFNQSARRAALGRYYLVVKKWLQYREDNLPMLEGLMKAGFRRATIRLASMVAYKPRTSKFFEVLEWNQVQAKDGRREIAVGKKVKKKDSWEGKTEKQICKIIEKEKPNWKLIVGKLPSKVGITQAILACAIESGCMSDKDLVILTPTIEEFGLHKVDSINELWRNALKNAEDQRAANIARNIKSKEIKETLQEAVDAATEKAFEEVTRNLRIYVIIDKSGSMEGALEAAQEWLIKILGGFPLDRTHVSVFNTMGTEVKIRMAKAAAVQQAFRGHSAGGGTSYAQGVEVLAKYQPQDDEDALMIFVGDEEDYNHRRLFNAVRNSGINPVAFGLMKVQGTRWGHGRGDIVQATAAELGIPCFNIDTDMFEADDPYAITRLLTNLIANTPVGERPEGRVATRKTRIQEILETPLLQKPVWA